MTRVLTGMIDARGQHAREAQGVAQLARNIGRELGLSDVVVGNLWLAGIVHDIGEGTVPAEILGKMALLDRHERNLVEAHIELSLRTVDESSLPHELSRALAQHHERLNGTGHPRQLRGDQIVLEARILAVADVFSALSSVATPGSVLPEEAVRIHLVQNAGLLYDRAVVDALFKVIKGTGDE
ncbi:MAG: HD domain-containing protein [Chloroflexi bacterium]|nr:HD domain-containing protein [Chloroflexota bacterium]